MNRAGQEALSNDCLGRIEMFEITVGKENSDYSTITEAIQAVPYEESAVIHIGSGIFRERYSVKKEISLLLEKE